MFRRGREAEKGGEKEEEEEEYPDDVEVECLHEYDEEDVYVVVELPPGMDAEALGTSTVTVKGIGTSNPQLQIGNETLNGKMEPIVGTAVAFKTPPAGSTGKAPLELECYSNMKINFNQPGNRPKRRSKPPSINE